MLTLLLCYLLANNKNMNKVFEFLKDRLLYVLGLLIVVLITIFSGAIESIQDGEYVPAIFVIGLFIIYGFLFYFDYQKYKKLE